MHGVFKALLNGVHARGTGGVLYVKGQECAYRFPREFGDETFRSSLASIVDGDDANFYVVEEKDGALHLLAYPKEHVFRAAVEEAPRVEEQA